MSINSEIKFYLKKKKNEVSSFFCLKEELRR